MIPYHLTAREAAKAALTAHAENRLAAQHDMPCVFDDGHGCGCAIGVALPPVLISYLAQCEALDCGLEYLVQHAQLVTTDDYAELHTLMVAHDCWHGMAQLARGPDNVPGKTDVAAERLHTTFLELAERLAAQ